MEKLLEPIAERIEKKTFALKLPCLVRTQTQNQVYSNTSDRVKFKRKLSRISLDTKLWEIYLSEPKSKKLIHSYREAKLSELLKQLNREKFSKATKVNYFKHKPKWLKA
mmetsp:Transcript_2513/g.3945  ORF Transcript_2513/g.3945 Transcript_2513/m.3945 type:complete len:109 (+) Transcript_2513:1494-1820(+)